MAEFLVRKEDSKTNAPESYKSGDVVLVYPDGTCTEPPSPNSPFYIIKVPGMTLEEAKKYTEPETDGYIITPWIPKEHLDKPEELTPKVIKQRAYRFDFLLLAVKHRNTLIKSRELTITKNKFLSSMRNKKTWLTEL